MSPLPPHAGSWPGHNLPYRNHPKPWSLGGHGPSPHVTLRPPQRGLQHWLCQEPGRLHESTASSAWPPALRRMRAQALVRADMLKN